MTDDLATNYERAGFSGRLPFGRRPALLLIDIVMVVFTRVTYQVDGLDGGLFFRKGPALRAFLQGSRTGLKVDRSEASKAFFFEKKKQKTFVSAVADLSGERATAQSKVFWSFFAKKDCLLSMRKRPCWLVSHTRLERFRHVASGAGG